MLGALGSGCGPSGLVGSSAQVLSTLTEEETEAQESSPPLDIRGPAADQGQSLGHRLPEFSQVECEVMGAPEAALSSAGLRVAQLWSGFVPRAGCRRGGVVMGPGSLRVAGLKPPLSGSCLIGPDGSTCSQRVAQTQAVEGGMGFDGAATLEIPAPACVSSSGAGGSAEPEPFAPRNPGSLSQLCSEPE